MPTSSDYTAAHIKVLEGLEPVRRRPGMYIGSTDEKGLHHLLIEVIDNSVDESLAGFTKNIWITLKQDGSAQVKDDGRGIPVDKHKSGVSALEVAMTKLHAGAKFDSQAYKVSGGLHGVGISVVNALSSWLKVEVHRHGKAYVQEYKRGKSQSPVKELGRVKDTGTITSFMPDKEVFKKDNVFNYKTVEELVRERAYLVSGLKFFLKDERLRKSTQFYFEGGIKSLVSFLNRNKKVFHEPIYISGGEENINAEIAVQFNDGFSENIESFVNVINTKDGGTHLTGFRIALTRAINDYAKKLGLLKEGNGGFTGDDTKEGLTAVIAIRMPTDKIQFESQTKAKLNNSEVQGIVATVVKNGLDIYFEEHPSEAKRILEKVSLAARARLAARAAKEAVIRKSEFFANSLPGKLADCQEKDPAFSELFIVEGDSAGGCFSGDTKVALTDGRNLTFKKLVKEDRGGKKNYCYTVKKDGTIGIALIKNPRLTKKAVIVNKIILDHNQEIICTPDHPFMLRNGAYKKAQDLTLIDSLMPLRRQISKIGNRITISGYELIFDPTLNRWIFTHLLADRYNLENKQVCFCRKPHRHHIDFNKLNNNPDNIQRVTKKEHQKLHATIVEKTILRKDVKEKLRKLRQTDEFKEKIRKTMTNPKMRKLLSKRAKEQWSNEKYKNYMVQKFLNFYRTNEKYRKENNKRLNKEQIKYWSKQENREKQSQKVREFFAKHPEYRQTLHNLAVKQWANPKLREWRSKKTSGQWTPEFREKRQQSYNQTYLKKALLTLRKILDEYGKIDIAQYNQLRTRVKDKSLIRFETIRNRFFNGDEEKFKEAITNYNHKIKKIIKLKKRIDVYDLEVENTHNFALASGIFVHNSAKQGRNRKFQAILPLGGKILNTERAHLDKIINFEELKDLIIALGMGIGETLNLNKIRYHRVIIMTDADVDGEHITTLLLTFFYRHLKPIIEQGFLYIALPPLYKIQAAKDSLYAYDDEEKEKILAGIRQKNQKLKQINIQRYKGLGEMNPQQLWETTMNPENRILKKVTFEDAQKADEIFTMLMGNEVLPRKRFIQMYAKTANLDV